MKAKKDLFGITKGRRLFEKIIWFVVAIACIGGVLFLMDRYVKDRTETVDIVVVDSEPIYQSSRIESYHIDRYAIIKKEYNKKSMFLWEDKDKVIGTYASYHLKEGTPVYQDAIYGERRYRNEWMYKIEEGQEVLTIPFDYRIAGGNILIPGDRVRIRVYFEGDDNVFDALPESEKSSVGNDGLWDDYQESTNYEISNRKGGSMQVVTLFEDIEVIDMLSNGESIYEKYLELKDMTEDERKNKLKDRNFVKTIIPDSMILVVDEDAALKYLQAVAVEAEFVITILPRQLNDTILDKVQLIENISDEINDVNNQLLLEEEQ